MTFNNVRSCDTVRAGAFFPQAQLQVPQKDMCEHRRQHMVVPARVFTHFIMGHPELRFPFFKALLNRLTQTAEPDKSTPGRARGRITDISILKFFQVDIIGMFRMTSSTRYFKEGVGSSRPNCRWIICLVDRPRANTSWRALVKRLSVS
jgi:hypothetical protein